MTILDDYRKYHQQSADNFYITKNDLRAIDCEKLIADNHDILMIDGAVYIPIDQIAKYMPQPEVFKKTKVRLGYLIPVYNHNLELSTIVTERNQQCIVAKVKSPLRNAIENYTPWCVIAACIITYLILQMHM